MGGKLFRRLCRACTLTANRRWKLVKDADPSRPHSILSGEDLHRQGRQSAQGRVASRTLLGQLPSPHMFV